jgi:hypothetical protein
MRLIGNYSSEWADNRGNTRNTLLVTLVVCAVGATASATIIFSLASSPATQSSVLTISPQAIVRNTAASEAPKTAQGGPAVEPMSSPQGVLRNAGTSEVSNTAQIEPAEPKLRAATSTASGHDQPATQTEAEHQTEIQSPQSRKHGRVVRHWREPYWRRFAHNSSPRPFGSW